MLPLLLFNNISPQGRRELAPKFWSEPPQKHGLVSRNSIGLYMVSKMRDECLLAYPNSFFLWFSNGGDSPKVWLEFLLIQVESARNGEMLLWFKAIVLETFCWDVIVCMVLVYCMCMIVCIVDIFMILCLFQNRIYMFLGIHSECVKGQRHEWHFSKRHW